MNYFVRAPGDSKMYGPYSLADIGHQLGTGGMRPDFEAHPAEGQSHGALMRSTAWLPITSVCPLDSITQTQPPASSQATASGGSQIEKSGVALLLSGFAWIELIASPIAGLAVGLQQSAYFGWMIFLSGFVSGLILMGFARVIEHLSESAQRLHRIELVLQKVTDVK